MPAMIEVYNDLGECVGRCDSKCYSAKDPGCSCICGGINHGVGLENAIENTRKKADSLEDVHYNVDLPAKRPVQLIYSITKRNNISLKDAVLNPQGKHPD